MTVTCSSFRCTPLQGGQVQLDIESPEVQTQTGLDPGGSRLLYVSDLVPILRKTPRAIYKLAARKRNPLPFIRGRGRPFCLEASLSRWILG